MQYFPRLDGVRGLAVLGVLATHWLAFVPGILLFQPGRIGVRVFFVLSGFLITRILINYRERMPRGQAARSFYWRRFLRLGPPLLFAVAFSALVGIANMREDWPWHVFYLSNFLLAARGTVDPAGHLWSLAVEEQFYLLWFVVVVMLPRRILVPAIIGAIILAPAFRLISADWPGRPSALTPAALDCLAFGCLIGLASLKMPRLYSAFGNWASLGTSGLVLIALLVFNPYEPVLISSISLFGACLIALAADPGAKGLDWLCYEPLRYLGKISYGVYLYHFFLPELFGYSLWNPLYIPLSIAVATASWVLIEQPAARLKDYQLVGRGRVGTV